MIIKVFYHQNFSGWNSETSQAVMDLINNHYDVPKHLKIKNIDDIKPPCFVIYSDKKRSPDNIIGVSFFTPITSHLVHTYKTVFHSEYRGLGFGTKLNEVMIDEFKRKGFKKITCNIYTNNKTSLGLKLKMDYIIEGTLRDHDFPGMHEYVLAKFL